MKFLLLIFSIISLAGCATAPRPHTIIDLRAAEGVYHEVRPGKDSFVWPVEGTVISYFGTKLDMVKNKGLDIKTSSGGDVRASRSGRVVFASDAFEGFGKTIIIDHGDGYQTVYAYNSRLLADVGDRVARSDVIAKAGRTGRAKTTALHFEIRKDGEPENPLDYLPR